jgi:hypothetical protein
MHPCPSQRHRLGGAIASDLDDRGLTGTGAALHGEVHVARCRVHLHVVDRHVFLGDAQRGRNLAVDLLDIHGLIAGRLGVGGVDGEDRGGGRVADEQQPLGAEGQSGCGFHVRGALAQPVVGGVGRSDNREQERGGQQFGAHRENPL